MGVFPPTAHCAPAQPVLELAGEQDTSFCPCPQPRTCRPHSQQRFAVSQGRGEWRSTLCQCTASPSSFSPRIRQMSCCVQHAGDVKLQGEGLESRG